MSNGKLWQLLRYAPPSLLTTVKRCTSPETRLWLRERLGARHENIPDSIIRVSGGRRFHIGPDRVYWALYYGLSYEMENSCIARRLLRPGDCVLDVGANFGWYTTLFAQAVGPTGKVFAFEPVSSTFERLQENIELNSLGDIVTGLQCAVGEREGESLIHIFGDKSHACASLGDLNQSNFSVEKVSVTTIDKLVFDCKIETIDFLKCDAEGSELSVLRGASSILNSESAPMILIELNDETSEAFGYSRVDIWDFLVSMGYDRFYAIRSANAVRRVSRDDFNDLGVMLCSRGDRLENRLATSTTLQSSAA